MVGETLRIQGTLTSGEEIVVNGELSGQLELNHRLTIGAKGKVEAGVKAKEVIIAGSVKGQRGRGRAHHVARRGQPGGRRERPPAS